MIDPAQTCLFIPRGMRRSRKLDMLESVGRTVGRVMRNCAVDALDVLPADVIPVIHAMPEHAQIIARWRTAGRTFIYWDRGYCRRAMNSDLPLGEDGGYLRCHVNHFGMQRIRSVPDDRWRALQTDVWDWRTGGDHIVICEPPAGYAAFHRLTNWAERIKRELRVFTQRPLVFRNKEMQRSGTKLHKHLKGAHAVVTHGSNAAVEAVIMGCPVFVDPCSAAALVGQTDLAQIESPIYPDRQPWLNSLAYCQYTETEMVDGTLWRLLD